MAATLYTYPIKPVNTGALESEIRAAGLPVMAGGVTVDAANIRVATDPALTAPQKTTMDGVVAAHVPPTPPPPSSYRAGTSVMGNSNWNAGPVVDIVATAAGQVLRRTSADLTFGAIDLASAAAVSGTLSEVNGGTGQAVVAAGDLLLGTAANVWGRLGPGAAGRRLEAGSTLPFWSSAHGVHAYLSAPQSIAHASFLPVSFTGSVNDSNAYWSASPNPSRVVIPSGLGGDYIVTAFMKWAVNTSGMRFLQANLNASPVGPVHTCDTANSDGTGSSTYACVVSVTAGQYLEMVVAQTISPASALNLNDARFSVWRL